MNSTHEPKGKLKNEGTKIVNDEFALTEYEIIEGEFTSVYTADFGGRLGKYVGQKIKKYAHRTFGGDANYHLSKNTREAMRLNFEKKFPIENVNQFSFIEIGNHERDIEGSKIGNEEQVNLLLEKYNPDQYHINEGFITYATGKKSKKILPHAELFKEEGKNKFCIIHLDSNILPFNKEYQKNIVKLIEEISTKNPDCPIVISLHHAPETYGIRRNSKSDSKKYIDHLKKIEVVNEDGKHISDKSWNANVSLALKDIYGQVPKANIIATQSGHDHYAGLMLQDNGTLAILQGNGSQEAIRFWNPKKQQAQPAYVEEGMGKLFGIDVHRPEKKAKYLRLGYGVWSFNKDNEPVYTQYYFKKLKTEVDPDKVYIATETIFKKNKSIVINDYLTGMILTKGTTTLVSRNPTLLEIEKILFPTCSTEFINELKQAILADPDLYMKRIIKAYRNDIFDYKTLKLLNSLTPKEGSISIYELEQIIKEYEKGKGKFRKWFGVTKTISDLKALYHSAKNENSVIYRADVELILALRDDRNNFFRKGSYQNNSLSFFKNIADVTSIDNKSLSKTEKAIYQLARKFDEVKNKITEFNEEEKDIIRYNPRLGSK